MELSSSEFLQGERIPVVHSADGAAVSPPLRWSSTPAATRSLVLICEDPDAPLLLPFVHWLLYDLPPELQGVPAALHGGAPDELCGGHVGRNSFLKEGWAGCAPPKGDDAHHYHFQLFALDRVLAIEPGAGRSRILEGTGAHVLGYGELVGTYQR
ncbi:MAG: YbhB/YbcL family Raf kinase inhibitor-like protein [Deltaproteobacteria bacterium]|nr:YbhB/YbcL family Raf kinase inhibitor-like protein [Deltaproteobacteria bacterium]